MSDLERQYLQCARSILGLLGDLAANKGVPKTSTKRREFEEHGYREYQEQKPVFLALLTIHGAWSDAWSRPHVDECVRAHVAEGILAEPALFDLAGNRIAASTWEQIREPVLRSLVAPLAAALNEHEALDVTDDELLNKYRTFRRLWSSTEFHYRVTIPLTHVEGRAPPTQIGPVLELAIFSPREKTDAWVPGFLDEPIAGSTYLMATLRLSGLFRHQVGTPLDPTPVIAEASEFLTALRLWKSGAVGAAGLITKPTVPLVAGFSSSFSPMPDFRVGPGGSTYSLAVDDLPQIMTLCTRLRDGNRRGWYRSLAVALRRFNQAYCRDAPEDRIIDLTIALESTLLFDIREELSYRLALRGAELLSALRPPNEVRALLETL